MFKFLFKLLLIAAAVYILIQVPFVRDQWEGLKASLFEKVGNVTTEVERVKGKVDEAKNTVNKIKEEVSNAKERYDELKTQVVETKEAFDDAVDKINQVRDTFSDKDAEAAPDSP